MKSVAAVLFLVAGVTACGPSTPPAPKKAEAPPEPVTGLHALYQMFTASRAWAPDSQIYELTSIHLDGVPAEPGKAGAWQVRFVSPSLLQSRVYTYSVTEASMSMHQGITAGKTESWSGPNGSTTKPFTIQAAKIDSDQAYQTALKKVADYAAKNPTMTITYLLAQSAGYNNAAWRVLWGESASSAAISVIVDSTTGAYVETLH